MKKIFNYKAMFIVVALLTFAMTAKGSNSLEELSDIEEIEYIYISESMLQSMGGRAPVDILSAISNLTSVEILTTEEEQAVRKIKKELHKIIDKLEIISKIKDDDEQISFYGIKTGNTYSRLLLILEEDTDEICLIELTGKIDPAALKRLQEAL